MLPAQGDFGLHVDLVIGVGDRVRQFRADALHLAQLAGRRRQHGPGRAERSKQPLADRRPHAGNQAEAKGVEQFVVWRSKPCRISRGHESHMSCGRAISSSTVTGAGNAPSANSPGGDLNFRPPPLSPPYFPQRRLESSAERRREFRVGPAESAGRSEAAMFDLLIARSWRPRFSSGQASAPPPAARSFQ